MISLISMATIPKGFPTKNDRAMKWLESLDPDFRQDLISAAKSVKYRFVLKEVQWLQIIRQFEVLFFDAISVDTSQTGAGKTFMAMFIAKVWSLYAKRLGLPFKLVVIYAKNAAPSWAEWYDRLNLYPYFESSYENLSSFRDNPNKKTPTYEENLAKENDPWIVSPHGYLAARSSTKRRNYTCFRATSRWVEDVITNCDFIIVDEIQKCKNESANNHAVSALLSPLTQVSVTDPEQKKFKYSRALLMSATPYDSDDNIVPWFRLFGGITEEMLTEGIGKNATQVGLDQILAYCRNLDPLIAEEIMEENQNELKPGGKYREVLFELFIQLVVIKFFRGTSADIPENLYQGISSFKLPKQYQNGQACIDKDKLVEMRKVLERLKEVVIGVLRPDGVRGYSRNMGEYTRIYKQLQEMKVPFLIEEGMEWLKSGPNNKLILVVNYLDHVEMLKQAFQAYNPLILTGEVKDKRERQRLQDAFQAANLNHRVFIFTSGAGSVSISLHDTNGHYPRKLIIMPSFHALDMLQAAGRIIRTGLKSKALVSVVYVNDYDNEESNCLIRDSEHPELTGSCLEKRLLEKINKRSQVVRTALVNNKVEGAFGKGILFFDQFKTVIEKVPECL